jgi:ribonuclease P protein component
VLPAAARMRRSAEFTAAGRAGARAAAPALVLHLRPAPTLAGGPASPRVGFIVSRAVGGAVVRNRLRRQLRHLLRQRLSQLPAGSYLVVRANPAAVGLSADVLAAQLDRALARVLGQPGGTRLQT